MNWLIPDSIAGRTLLVVLVILTVSHVLSVALYFSDRTNALTLAGEAHVGERIASVVELVENAPEEDRPRILDAFTSPDLRVDWATDGNVRPSTGGDLKLVALQELLGAYLTRADGRAFAARYAVGGDDGMMRINASVQLEDGGWLNFVAAIEVPRSLWSVRFTLSVVVMMIAVLALSALVVHHLVGPLRVFSRAAERLGFDIHAPPLREHGPREVRDAARAFNEMQSRIRKLVDDRTRMLAAISHDLRTPITRLRLRADFVEDEEQHEKTLRDLDEMESMISSLLSFARDDASEEAREIVDLVALLQSVCDDMADMGHAIDFSDEGRLPYSCSRLALRRAFTNLLENAVRYGERARVTFTKSDDRVVVHIDDDGPGIPESEKEKAFAAFYRIEPSRNRETGGSGVGLHVARTIIRGHGGEISLENRQEGGLRVKVVLPR